MPADPVAAVKVIGARLAAGTTRTIGLGLAGDRYFTFNAGLGWDAEVVRAVEGRRARGRRASTTLYMRMALREYYCAPTGVTRRWPWRRPAEPRCRPGHGAGLQHHALELRRPPSGEPDAERHFDTGLDVFACAGCGHFPR